jgi:uncharacterized protein (TIGR04540 family)
MPYEFREIIFTVNELAQEIVAACNAYKQRSISSSELSNILMHYAVKYPHKLFNGSDINSTIKLKIGKKRTDVLSNMLAGYQPRLF